MTSHHDVRARARNRLWIAGLLSAVLLVAEFIGGVLSHSLALISDAGHMLADVAAIFLSLLAIFWATKPADRQKTFGYYRMEILASLANAVFLLFIAFQVFWKAGHRFLQPGEIHTGLMLPIAIAGLVTNLVVIGILRNERGHLATRSALFHVIADTISSVGVVLTAIAIRFGAPFWLDSAASGFIAVLIAVSGLRLVRECLGILLESSPDHIALTDVQQVILGVTGVKDVHDLHVWTISSGFHAASAHVLLDNMDIASSERIVSEITQRLHDRFGVGHTTVQVAVKPGPIAIQALPRHA